MGDKSIKGKGKKESKSSLPQKRKASEDKSRRLLQDNPVEFGRRAIEGKGAWPPLESTRDLVVKELEEQSDSEASERVDDIPKLLFRLFEL